MARPREFTADAVLDSAMRVFWAQGYEATSLDDSCAATDLNRSSLYASFGDKRALLLMSIERYIELGPPRIAAMLAQAIPRAQEHGELGRDADVAALARFFMSSMQGLRLVGKVNPDRSTLEDITSTMLRLLE
jgi:AcrR family transcriptional regulator